MNAVMLSVNSACLAVYQSSPGEIKHIIIPCIYIIIYIGRIWKNCVFYTWDCPASAWGKQSFCSFIWVARCCTAALFAALVTQVFHGSAFCICKEPRGLTNNAKFLTAQETSKDLKGWEVVRSLNGNGDRLPEPKLRALNLSAP